MKNPKPVAEARLKHPDNSAASPGRRQLLAAVAAGGIVSLKSLPQTWSQPIIDSVLLPAHAQTTSCEESFFEQTQGFDIPEGEFGFIPDQPLTFELDGARPCGNGTVAISNLVGDLGDRVEPPLEQWTIWLGDVGTGVELGSTQNSPNDCEPAAGSVFPVSQADLLAAISGDSIVITAENGGDIEDSCETNTMNVTLRFPILCCN